MTRIAAKCYGGPLDGEWVVSHRQVIEVAIGPSMQEIAALDMDSIVPVRTVTYAAMRIRPAGWRVAFPVFVQYRSSTGEAVARLEATYAGGERCSLPRRHLTPEELADRYWPVKRNGAI